MGCHPSNKTKRVDEQNLSLNNIHFYQLNKTSEFEGCQSAVFVQTTLHYAELLLDAALKAGTVKSLVGREAGSSSTTRPPGARIAGERMGLAPFEADPGDVSTTPL